MGVEKSYMYQFELRVRGSEEHPDSLISTQIWDNLLNYVYSNISPHSSESSTTKAIRRELDKFNAVSVPGPFIYFLTEKERTLFVLRWA